MAPRPPKFKFYLDENFPVPAGEFLKSLGHSVVYGIKYLKKEGLLDYKHLEAAIKLEAILLSFDRDFIITKDLKEKVKDGRGVILIEATTSNLKILKRILNKILKELSIDSAKGKICRATIDKIEFI